MTCDMQRYTPTPPPNFGWTIERTTDGPYVLAADAEAHEQAAVEQAIRECITAIEPLLHDEPCDCDTCRVLVVAQNLMRVLRDRRDPAETPHN